MEDNNNKTENYENPENVDFNELFDEEDIKSWSFYTEDIDERLAVNVCNCCRVDCSK